MFLGVPPMEYGRMLKKQPGYYRVTIGLLSGYYVGTSMGDSYRMGGLL